MLDLHRIGQTIYYSLPEDSCDLPCIYAIVGNKRTLMVDSGVSAQIARGFMESLRCATGRGVDLVTVTHWHWDHTFGLSAVDAPLLACRATDGHLRRMAGYGSWSDEALDRRVKGGEEIFFSARHIKRLYPGQLRAELVIRVPDVIFDGELAIDLGGVTCQVLPLPPVHTDDSCAVWVPEEGALLLGDSLGPEYEVKPNRYRSGPVLELFSIIRAMGAQVLAESHDRPADPQEFLRRNGILETAADGVRRGFLAEPALMEYLNTVYSCNLPDDAEEIAAMFAEGAKYDASVERGVIARGGTMG